MKIMKNFEDEIHNIKGKINNIKLSEDFKENLANEMDLEYNNKILKKKKNIFLPRKIIAACACFVILSSCVFADEIENFVNNLLSNTTPSIEQLLENDKLQKINMDYVEKDGISIKVDSILMQENAIYLVFDILSEYEYDDIFFQELMIKDDRNNIIYSNVEKDLLNNKSDILYTKKRLNKKNEINIIKITNSKYKNDNANNIIININKVDIIKDSNTRNIENKWEFNIKNEAQS